MKIAFHGAAQTVTGTKYLVSLENGNKLLLDCGLFQGMGPVTDSLNRDWGFVPAELSCVFLSHAHIDHSGLLPKLVKDGFRGKIFATAPSRDLAAILLEDAASIQESAAGDDPATEPYYGLDDVRQTLGLFEVCAPGQWFSPLDEVEVLFTPSGHLPGAVAVHLRVQENGSPLQLSFTGDVGRYRDLLLPAPEPFPQADYIIMESTYGDKLHEASFGLTDQLMDIIDHTCVQQNGKLIIPAFSVGRTQELLYYLNQLSLEKRLPAGVPIVVDSPLGLAATAIVKRYTGIYNERVQAVLATDEDPFHFPDLHFTQTPEDSMKLPALDGPCIIIASSGMAEAGRVRHHLRRLLDDRRNTVLITGYCAPYTLGARLVRGEKTVSLMGEEVEVKAAVQVLRSLSAHGDYDDLLQYLSCQDPSQVKRVFLVHGETEAQLHLQKKLELKGFTVHVPALHETCGLSSPEEQRKSA